MSLHGVVVDELLDAGLDELDFGEDFVGRGGPGERPGVRVPVVDVVADLLDQDLDAGEGAAADRLAGDDAEPGFDLVEPGGALGGEVEPDVRVAGQPCLDLGCGVGGEVVQDDVNLLATVGFDGFLQEGQEVSAVAAGCELTDDIAGTDVQSGEQVRGSVTAVIIG